jgi:hypothetical protein
MRGRDTGGRHGAKQEQAEDSKAAKQAENPAQEATAQGRQKADPVADEAVGHPRGRGTLLYGLFFMGSV